MVNFLTVAVGSVGAVAIGLMAALTFKLYRQQPNENNMPKEI